VRSGLSFESLLGFRVQGSGFRLGWRGLGLMMLGWVWKRKRKVWGGGLLRIF
jgi:hypothetical protein